MRAKRRKAFSWRMASLVLGILLVASSAFVVGQQEEKDSGDLTLHFFWAANCPHCGEEKPFLERLSRDYPRLKIMQYDVWNNRDNFNLLVALSEKYGTETVSTPTTVVGERIWYGFSDQTAREIEAHVKELLGSGEGTPPATEPEAAAGEGTGYLTRIPLLGDVDLRQYSLPLLTILLGLMDSFNPCAFFILLFLLSLLIHARSRKRMLLVGGTFVFFSGVIYFLFMAAWLNLFLLAGNLPLITAAAGAVAVLIALVNIKDFFWFKKGVSLSIPESAKPKLFARMRALLEQNRLGPVLLGTVVLAVAANSYELLCTAGFPMVYTRLLTLHHLQPWQYYGFLGVYNLVYVLPLLLITLVFTWTLGSRKLSQWEGRILKLMSGLMMGQLGALLLFRPDWLQSIAVAVGMLATSVVLTAMIVFFYDRIISRGKGGSGMRGGHS